MRLKATLAAIGAALLALITFGASQRRRGRQEGVERVSHRAKLAAESRKEKRNEINDNVAAGGAADRLRKDWSRD